ncbi:MAG: HD domain-containing protein [Leadbetterella sp.]|nr:HD domain-containing protein [Leadbetterella sp.]
MDYRSLKKTVMDRLRKELSPHLVYHNTRHVRDVIRAAGQIAAQEGVRGEALILLKTAALFHDTGFLFSAEGHEERSCELAGEYLPSYGYSGEAIEKIKGMIRATRLPNTRKPFAGKFWPTQIWIIWEEMISLR